MGLIVPNVFSPLDLIPSWNGHNLKNIEAMFAFADGILTDDTPLLLLSLPEFKIVRDDIRAYSASYGFALAKDWCAINELLLCLPIYTNLLYTLILNLQVFFFEYV